MNEIWGLKQSYMTSVKYVIIMDILCTQDYRKTRLLFDKTFYFGWYSINDCNIMWKALTLGEKKCKKSLKTIVYKRKRRI